ncbi:MAG: N-6 DNA methylase, partial [Candidatus Komeilibacteria bacterium]
HQFKNPKIFQYDTLSMEDRWADKFDVIMANPPFMSPRGGVQTHHRFSIQSSRSEVLFVDYIINHLRPQGRAGIIVPEGVLANTNAGYYSDIRKLLIQDNIWAIVSLHSFVFAPYASVTTFILFIDKELSRKTKRIIFCDIEEDGFDKSDQRRIVEINDIPQVYDNLIKYRQSLLTNIHFRPKNKKFKFVDKKLLEETDNHVLLSSRYEEINLPQTKFPLAEIATLIEECKGRANSNKFEVWSVSNRLGFVPSKEYFEKKIASENTKNYKIIEPGYFAFNPSRINVGSVACNLSQKRGIVSPMYTVFKIIDESIIDKEYLLSYLKSDLCQRQINHKIQGATRKVLKKDDLGKLRILLPPMDIQRKLMGKVKIELSKIVELQDKIQEHSGNISSILLGLWDE